MFEKKENIILSEILSGFRPDKSAIGETKLKGIPSSPGLAFGTAYVIEPETITTPTEKISAEDVQSELDRFSEALLELRNEFLATIEKIKIQQPKALAIIETNLAMISDDIFIEAIVNRINQFYSAESSVIFEFDAQKQLISQAKDHFLRERAIELDHIKEHLLAMLRHKSFSFSYPENSVIVAQSLTPTDIINMKENGVLAIITEVGGITSHASLLARSFEIPAVIGIKDATQIIQDSSKIIVDGYNGVVIINPVPQEINLYNDRKSKEDEHKAQLGELIKLSSDTIDGTHIQLMANVDFPEDAEAATLVGSEGIGLVRSEQLVITMNQFPDEEVQFKWYKEIADRAYPNLVTIRVFDVGSDKYAEGMPKHENNPALGFRGIRFLMHREDIFNTQLRAILRASRNKNLRIMLPMITHNAEIIFGISAINKCKEMLKAEEILYDLQIPIGIMIETPAAALLANLFAEHVNFFSIGTNDLTQYTLAVDRTNELVNDLFDSFHPAVLKLIKLTIDAAKKKGIPVGICGELAGHAAATELLIGLGVNELSVSPTVLLELKNRVRNIKYKKAKKFAKEVMNCASYEEVCKKLGLR